MSKQTKTSEADARSLPHDAPPAHTDDPKKGVSEGDARTRPSNAEKDPDHWTTGGETMTGAQASYLQTLCEEAGEPFDPDLSKADASKRIDALQARTGRGRDH
jgi:hypothetical protein